jgi:DNA-binding transcriptional ArsR family regulator
MVNAAVKSDRLDRVFAALAHPTRRRVLARLKKGEASVSQLAAPFEISLPAMTRHIHVLEDAGLVARQVDGRVHRLHLLVDPLRDAALWMATYASFWSQQFDALDRFLDATEPKRKRGRRPREDRR